MSVLKKSSALLIAICFSFNALASECKRIKGEKNIELSVKISPESVKELFEAFDLEEEAATIRHNYFFDHYDRKSQSFALHSQNIILRTRITTKPGESPVATTSVKFRTSEELEFSDISSSTQLVDGFKLERDMTLDGNWKDSASLKSTKSLDGTKSIILGAEGKFWDLFDRAQIGMLDELIEGEEFKDTSLKTFGPVTAQIWDKKAKNLDLGVTGMKFDIEIWHFPLIQPLIEISTKFSINQKDECIRRFEAAIASAKLKKGDAISKTEFTLKNINTLRAREAASKTAER